MADNKALATLRSAIAGSAGMVKSVGADGLDVRKFLMKAQYQVQVQPALQGCTPKSVLRGIVLAARLNLDLEPTRGQFYLIPFKDKHTNTTVATPVIGYKGYADLVTRSGKYGHVQAFSVHKGDRFNVKLGTSPEIEHVPDYTKVRDDSTLECVYAVAFGAEGQTVFEVMSKKETDAVRDRSRAKGDGPWITDTVAMRKKCAVLRLSRGIPYSVDLSLAVAVDDAADSGQSADGVIDAEFSEVEGMGQIAEAPAPPANQGDALAQKLDKRRTQPVPASDPVTGAPIPPKKQEPISEHRSDNADIQLLLDCETLAGNFTDEEFDALKAQLGIEILAEAAPGRLQGLKNAMQKKLAERK